MSRRVTAVVRARADALLRTWAGDHTETSGSARRRRRGARVAEWRRRRSQAGRKQLAVESRTRVPTSPSPVAHLQPQVANMALADQVFGFYIPNVSLMGVGSSKQAGPQVK